LQDADGALERVALGVMARTHPGFRAAAGSKDVDDTSP
jgi:hypothetical protein